jgi:hypothetical protein
MKSDLTHERQLAAAASAIANSQSLLAAWRSGSVETWQQLKICRQVLESSRVALRRLGKRRGESR